MDVRLHASANNLQNTLGYCCKNEHEQKLACCRAHYFLHKAVSCGADNKINGSNKPQQQQHTNKRQCIYFSANTCTEYKSKKIPLTFSRKRLPVLIFSPNFTRLLHVPIYARLQIFIQLFPTVMKLCHINCDHPASQRVFRPMVDVLSI